MRSLFFATALGLAAATSAHAALPDYDASWMLPDMVKDNVVFGTGRINNHGEIVGSRGIQGNTYSLPFLWSASEGYRQGRDLPGGAKWAGAGAINDAGLVVGFASTATGQHAVVFARSGAIRDLAPLLPAGVNSGAVAVNNRGQVLGSWSTGPHPETDGSTAFVWSRADGMQALAPAPGLDTSMPTGINDSGVIVGWGCSPTTCTGFRGTLADGLAVIPGLPMAVNASGQVVGHNENFGPAFIWDEQAGYADLPLPTGSSSCAASDINADGVVVGYCDGAAGGAVAWYPGAQGYAVSTLADHIGGRPTPFPPCIGETCFYSYTADAINDAGQIVMRIAAYPYGYIDDGDLLVLTPKTAR